MKSVSPLIEWCRHRIAQGETHIVITELEKMQISSVRNQITLISNRWKELQQLKIQDTIGQTEYELGRNRINADLLQLLDMVESRSIAPDTSMLRASSKRVVAYTILAVALLFIGAFALFKIGVNGQLEKASMDAKNYKEIKQVEQTSDQPEELVEGTISTSLNKEPLNSPRNQDVEPSKIEKVSVRDSKETAPLFDNYQDALKYALNHESNDTVLYWMKKAINLTRSTRQKGDVYYHLGMFYYKKLNEKDEALKWLQEAYNIDPIPRYKKMIDLIRSGNSSE